MERCFPIHIQDEGESVSLYPAAAAQEYRNGAEMRAAHKARRNRLFDDSQLVTSLRVLIERERREHKHQIEQLEDRIAALQIERAEFKAKLDHIESVKDAQPTTSIDKVKYAFPRVLRAICTAHRVAEAELKSDDRRFHICRARMHLVNILTVHRPDLSTPVIGKLIGRDHTTVLNARYRWPHIRHKVRWAMVQFEREIAEYSCGKPVDNQDTDQIETGAQCTDNP